jgi:histidinol-phosphate aminotransferase
MKNVKDLVLDHLKTPKPYDAIRTVETLSAETGIPPSRMIRLNGNENSYGPSPKVGPALGTFDQYNRYPDPQQTELKEALSSYTGAHKDSIVAGNGSDELIDLIIRLFVGKGDKIIEPSPTFGMYGFSARLAQAEIIKVPRDANFDLDIAKIKQVWDKPTKVIFIAHPNNPTGNPATRDQLIELLALNSIIVVDEAYHEYCGQTCMDLIDRYPNLIVLRTFSKWAGLAGLRIGLGVMNPEIARLMMTIKPPYNINKAAEEALKASLEDKELLLSRITPVIEERERLFRLMTELPGVTPITSAANFMMIRLPQGRGKDIFHKLAYKGILTRYYDYPEMTDCIRVSIGLPWEIDGFTKGLTEILNQT